MEIDNKTIRKLKEDSYTAKQVSFILDLDLGTTRNIIKREKLCYRIGGKIYVKKEKLMNYIAKINKQANK